MSVRGVEPPTSCSQNNNSHFSSGGIDGNDTVHHRLFSGCRSGVMAVSDYQAARVVTTVPIGMGVDGAGYDPASGNAFASNADGTLTVIHQDSADNYDVVQIIKTPQGSRNMGLDWGFRRS
jgi:hypothetical protein